MKASTPACITDLTSAQLEQLLTGLGEPAYRARQLQSWVYQRLAISYDEMTDLTRELGKRLSRESRLHSLTPVHEVTARDGTVKALFAAPDGKTVESTLMSYPPAGGRPRHTICLSTQVGCAIGCPFCATGQQGFERNLTPGEIVDQVLHFARRLRDRAAKTPEQTPAHITNLVFMGMGEPLANYQNLWQAVETLNSPSGFGLGARHMTISTAGLVTGIERLSREKLEVGLAVSLHAAGNGLRDRLVPVNRSYPLEQLIPACREYFQMTGRRPSFEYALFQGVNDSLDQASALASLLKGLNCHVNLIPANHTAQPDFRPPSRNTVLAFERELKRLRVACTLREKRGVDIEAGCGQLRSRLTA